MKKLFLLLLCSAALCLTVGCPKDDEDDPIPPPELTNPQASPSSVVQGNTVRFTVQASSTGSTITTVTIDLTVFGGSATQSMYDDGTNGDLASGDGMYSYSFLMPNNATVGAHSLDISAEDAVGNTAGTTLPVTVVQNQAPTISNGTVSLNPLAPGARFTVTVDASDTDGTLYSVEADLSPLGLVSNATLYDDGTHGDAAASDGTFSFESVASTSATPTTGASIVFTATDNAAATNTTSVTFDISSNIVPTLTNESVTPSWQVQLLDVTFSVDVTDTDGTVASVQADLSSLDGSPTQALTNTGGDTYEYVYSLPSDCPPGTWQIIITAEDDAAETNFTYVYLTVSANTPPTILSPTAAPDPCSRNRNVLLTAYVSDSDGTVSSVEVDLSSIGGSATQAMNDSGTNGDVTASDGTYSYAFFIAHDATVTTYSFQVTATDDDTVSSTDSISLDTLANRAPEISNPQASPSTQEVGLSVTFSVTATDHDGGHTVEIDLSSIGGSATQAMTNTTGDTWEYAYILPGATTAGAKTLPVTVDDTVEQDTTNISLTVQANQSPTLQNAAATPDITLPGRTITVTVDASDTHGIASVTANLSNFSRSASEPMYDDGTHGDTGPDGTWTCQFTAGGITAPGQQTITITALDTMAPAAQAQASPTVRIARYHLEHAAFLEDIHGTSSSDAWAVGEASQVYHWDGTDWRLVDPLPGSNVDWWSVWAASTTDVWIGGESGTVRRFDGMDWTDNSPSGAGSYEIRGIWGDGSGNVVVAGGYNGTTSAGGWANTWDGSSWGGTAETDGNDAFNDVFGATATDVLVVGDDGEVRQWDGSNWSTPTGPATGRDLFGVWGYDDGTTTYWWVAAGDRSRTTDIAEIWTVSYGSGGSPGTWTQVTSLPYTDVDLQGIYGSVSAGGTLQAIFVAGKYSFSSSRAYGTVWRSTNGSTFTQVTTGNNYFPNAPYRLILTDAWVPPAGTDCWIAGHRSIQYYNPTANPTWAEYSRGTYEDTRAVSAVSSTRGVTVDFPVRPTTPGGRQISAIMHDYVSGSWNEYTEYTGTVGTEMGTYSMLNPPSGQSGTPVCPRIYAVKMFSSSAIYGVGDDGRVMFWDGQNTVSHDFTSQHQYGTSSSNQRRLYALWGTSATDFWFGGEDGYVYHYQNAGWPAGAQSFGANEVVTGLWGTSNSNIYAVTAATGVGGRSGTEGNVYQFDGSNWTSIAGTDSLPNAGSGNLNAVWGTGSSDVFVAGDGGSFHHWDGTNWTDASGNLSGLSGADIMAIFGDASLNPTELYVVGDNMRVWLRRGATWYDLRACGGGKDLLGGDSNSTLILLAGQDGITLRLEK